MLDVRAPASRAAGRALALWAGLIVVAVVAGRILVSTGHDLILGTPPFFGKVAFHASPRVVPALLFAALVIAGAPSFGRRLSWRALLAVSWLASVGWAVVLAYIDGRHALTHPLSSTRNDYLQTARTMGPAGDFLRHFVDRIGTYNQHTMGHPPGMVLVERVLLQLHRASPAWDTALVVGGGAAATIAALVACRDVAGEAVARRAAPFLVLVPAAIWWSAADAFFAGVVAWAITALVLATGRRGARADALAVSGGVLFGAAVFLSYGLAVLALVPVAVAVVRRRARVLLLGAGGAAVVFVAFAVAGFSWVAGLNATRHQYAIGAAAQRPYGYFVFANLAVFAVATGPGFAIALSRARVSRAWLLPGAAIVCLLLADLSGMSKAEVERIWLPFVPWVMLACGASEESGVRSEQHTVVLQVACAITTAVTLWSPW